MGHQVFWWRVWDTVVRGDQEVLGEEGPRAQVPPYKKGGTLYGQASLVCLGLAPHWPWARPLAEQVEMQVSNSQSLCHSDRHTSGPGTLSYNRVKIWGRLRVTLCARLKAGATSTMGFHHVLLLHSAHRKKTRGTTNATEILRPWVSGLDLTSFF